MSKKPLSNKAFLSILEFPRKIFLIVLFPFIFIYQKIISPILGPRCKYHPSCSNYFVEAIKVHGIFKGLIFGITRLDVSIPNSTAKLVRLTSKSA